MVRALCRRLSLKCATLHLLAGLALVGYTLSVVGFPAVKAAKSSAIPFPCQDNPCGCATAEQCYTSCCCHTAAERLAWAKEHGVTLPSDWQAALEVQAGEAKSCCSQVETSECPCCAKKKKGAAKSSWSWALGSLVKKCRGLGPDSTLVVCALAPCNPYSPEKVCRAEFAPLPLNECVSSISSQPVVPPPRLR